MNKFRVFDKQNKKYLSEEELKNTFINHKGKLVHATGGRFPYEWHEDRFVVEWYTGSKDKNGVEIYEGDIVNVNSRRWENSEFGNEIVKNEGLLGFRPFNKVSRQIDLGYICSIESQDRNYWQYTRRG